MESYSLLLNVKGKKREFEIENFEQVELIESFLSFYRFKIAKTKSMGDIFRFF
jgi:hypothetical protein